MNPNLCRIELRPRGVLEVFDLSWRVLADNGAVTLRLFALVMLPVWLLALPIGWYTDWHWGVGLGVFGVATCLRIPFTMLAGRRMFSDTVRARTMVAQSLRMLPQLVGMLLVHVVGLVIGAFTCGLMWLPIWAGLAWMPEALVLEQHGGERRFGAGWAARRSWHLASLNGGGALGSVAASLFLSLWFAGMAEASGAAVTGFLLQVGTPFGTVLDAQVTPWMLLGLVAAQPVIALYRLLLYVDTRTRSEGWDLQVSLRALGLA